MWRLAARPFACKSRGVCPSCMGRRMGETAALLVDHRLPAVPDASSKPNTNATANCPPKRARAGAPPRPIRARPCSRTLDREFARYHRPFASVAEVRCARLTYETQLAPARLI